MPGFIGMPEIILLGVLALLLFGPKKLPEIGRGLGKGLREFKASVGGEHGGDDETHTLLIASEPTSVEPAHAHKVA